MDEWERSYAFEEAVHALVKLFMVDPGFDAITKDEIVTRLAIWMHDRVGEPEAMVEERKNAQTKI